MRKNYIFSVLKGILISVIITAAGVLMMALLVKGTEAQGTLISGLSIAVKIISIVAGTIYTAAKIRRKGALCGIFVAVPYWTVCLLLSMISEPLQFSLSTLLDLVLTAFTGAFGGILTVNAIK